MRSEPAPCPLDWILVERLIFYNVLTYKEEILSRIAAINPKTTLYGAELTSILATQLMLCTSTFCIGMWYRVIKHNPVGLRKIIRTNLTHPQRPLKIQLVFFFFVHHNIPLPRVFKVYCT